jgi:hypothetical protein
MKQWHCNVAAGVVFAALITVAGSGLPPIASAQQFSAAEIRDMKEGYKRPPARPVENQALVDLGRLLGTRPA